MAEHLVFERGHGPGEQLALFIDFENVAIWAEEHFFDLRLDQIMTFLQSRGPVVVKRAYGDWSRFPRYRDDLVESSIDLVQLYSVRAGKNRADIRLALDAFETAINRPQIGTIVIVSGDSDFGALAAKLREYGRYILGIGPRAITHPLLVKSCDEFVYLEVVLGQEPEPLERAPSAREGARLLLARALSAYGKRGELPVLAAKLKQTMLSMDPTFNEANLGYAQFRAWLEDNPDLANLFFRGLAMYVAPVDFQIPREFGVVHHAEERVEEKAAAPPQATLAEAYMGLFSRAIGVDLDTRRDVLRDVYRLLSEQDREWWLGTLLDELQGQYEAKGLVRSKTLLRKLLQLGFTQGAYAHPGAVSDSAPLKLAQEIDSQSAFIRRIESRFPYVVVEAGLEIDAPELAAILVDDRTQVGYIEELLGDLEQRGLIVHEAGRYRLPSTSDNPLLLEPALNIVFQDLEGVPLPESSRGDVESAQDLAKSGMARRTQDFAGSARDFLQACRIHCDALERKDPRATLEELRWYVASYASVKAGELSQVQRRYRAAHPYYLAFFSLVHEDTPLWDRMRGLMNPMLTFYWRNLARELKTQLLQTTPAGIAVELATHPDAELRSRWQEATRDLAAVNPDLLQRIANQVRLIQTDSQVNAQVADQIEAMLRG